MWIGCTAFPTQLQSKHELVLSGQSYSFFHSTGCTCAMGVVDRKLRRDNWKYFPLLPHKLSTYQWNSYDLSQLFSWSKSKKRNGTYWLLLDGILSGAGCSCQVPTPPVNVTPQPFSLHCILFCLLHRCTCIGGCYISHCSNHIDIIPKERGSAHFQKYMTAVKLSPLVY